MFNSHLIKCTYIRFKPSNPGAGPPLFASSAYQFIPPTNHGPLSHPYLERDARRKSAQIKRKLPSATGAKTIISNYNWGMYTVSVVVVGLRSWHRCAFFLLHLCVPIYTFGTFHVSSWIITVCQSMSPARGEWLHCFDPVRKMDVRRRHDDISALAEWHSRGSGCRYLTN